GQSLDVVNAAAVDNQQWVGGHGRWAQVSESFDFETDWSPRRRLVLNRQGEWSAVAFALAMELANETMRQADLDGLAFFDETHPNDDRQDRYELMRQLIWPELLEAEASRALVWQLHQMTAELGTDEMLSLLAATLQETKPDTAGQLLAAMEQRSDNLNNEVQP
ncbi:MAG TPA: hypothetical protein VIG89_06105, partial [Candidatus Acidoferrales bacterium]